MNLRILFGASEFSPLARTGGLGDAVAGLATSLAAGGDAVTVALPRYRHLAEEGDAAGDGIWRATHGGVQVLLIDDPEAFDRAGTLYGPAPGQGYEDEWWRWGRFAARLAVLAADHDVLHLHDAHAGAAALLSPVPSVFTVHNPAYPIQGPLGEAIEVLGLAGAGPARAGLEWYGRANYVKAGLLGATQATTVSPTFAGQLAGGDEESFGLGGVVRSLVRPMVGVLNGIDVATWDPSDDPLLPELFSAADPSGRDAARAGLVERAGLEPGMVFGMVGRMSGQKGIELLDAVIDELVPAGFRFVAVGNGELDGIVDGWVTRYPGSVAHFEFSDPAAHLTFAGCDAYLMPSRFEPSGLGQLYAMRYGAPPVVHLTGGLADSVIDVSEDAGLANGFGFGEYLPDQLAATVLRAMQCHAEQPELWRTLQQRGMRADWSWARRAGEYREIYRSVLA